MSEINLLMKTLTKDEASEIIYHFNIPVTGFINVSKAPEKLLSATLKKELERGITKRSRKRGKKYTDPKEVYSFLARKYVTPNEIDKLNLELLSEKTQTEKFHSKAALLSTLYLYLPDVFQKHLEKIEKNIDENIFLLNGIIEEMSIEEKLSRAKTISLTNRKYREILEELEIRVIGKVGKENYKDMVKRFSMKGEEIFYTLLMKCKKGDEYKVIVPFLLTEERFKKPEFSPFLSQILYEFFLEKHKNEKNIKADYEELSKEFQKISFELKTEQKNVQALTEAYEEVKAKQSEINRKLEDVEGTLESEKKIGKSYCEELDEMKLASNFIEHILDKKNILLVTNEIQILTNRLFEGRTMDLDTFSKQLKDSNMSCLKGKVICITRISYSKTEIWRKHTNYLRQKGISYCELSGYEIEKYVEEIMEFIYKREREGV